MEINSQSVGVKDEEQKLKKKLQRFLQDLQRWGTLAGFRHFTTYIRGREEIVLTIKNNLESTHPGDLSWPESRRGSVCPTPSDSLTSSHLPYDKGSLVLSHNTQLGLSGRKERGIGLPPASPSDKEDTVDQDVTLFLLAGYGRYLCPYVWVRSNHERLFRISESTDYDRDSPLRLKSTSKWKDSDVHPSDIIAELVRLCTYPRPLNPFEINMDHFLSLPQTERLLASAAMMETLQKVVVHTPDSKSYAGKVAKDLQLISRLHFKCLSEIAENRSIPVLQQNLQQHRSKQNQRQCQQRQYPNSQPVPHRSQPTSSSTLPEGQQRQMFSSTSASQRSQQQQQQHRPPQVKQHAQMAAANAGHNQGTQPQNQRGRQPNSQQVPPPPQPNSHGSQQLRFQYPERSQQQQHSSLSQVQQKNKMPAASMSQKQVPHLPSSHQHPQVRPPPNGNLSAPLPTFTFQAYSTLHHQQVSQGHAQHPTPYSAPQQSTKVYGSGARGAFPGGFERTPAPSLF